MNLPNKLTLMRVVLIPVFVVAYYLSLPYAGWIAAAVFTIASVTDFFDGMIARKQGIVTDFGKLMDPMADKLLVGTGIILLCGSGDIHPIIVAVLIGREFVIGGYRLVAASKGIIMAADVWGKIKTVTQIVGIIFLLVHMSWKWDILKYAGDALIYISVILSVLSCVNYILSNKSVLSK